MPEHALRTFGSVGSRLEEQEYYIFMISGLGSGEKVGKATRVVHVVIF